MSWLDKYKILACRINPVDYPDYTRSERVCDVPGLVLGEHYAVRGIRYAVTAGCALSVIYYYGMVRPRLAFADRSLVKLHHYFYPSAGYTTPIGLGGGLLYGVYAEGQWVDDSRVRPSASQSASRTHDPETSSAPSPSPKYASELARDQINRESRAAWAAFHQYGRRRQDLEEELRKSQRQHGSFLTALGCALGLGGTDTVAIQLAKLGFAEPKQWVDFVEPYGLLWTRLHSAVHDARFYKNYTGPIVADATRTEDAAGKTTLGRAVATSSGNRAAAGVSTTASGADASVTGRPPDTPLFTKEQADVVVSRASCLRNSPDEKRWSKSAGRFATYGIATTVLAWNSGNLLFRVSMGLGLGVVAGAIVSATRLDDAFKHL